MNIIGKVIKNFVGTIVFVICSFLILGVFAVFGMATGIVANWFIQDEYTSGAFIFLGFFTSMITCGMVFMSGIAEGKSNV